MKSNRSPSSGVDEVYEAGVTFVPSSIRLYPPALPIDILQRYVEKKLTKYAGALVELDWEVYPGILNWSRVAPWYREPILRDR